MTDIGTSQARGLAADDVLFMQQITGDTGSGLQGYAPDAFLHFPGISRVRRTVSYTHLTLPTKLEV